MVLQPGEHRVALDPGADESPVWRSEQVLKLAPDSISFLALWNMVESSFGSSQVLVPVAGVFMPMQANYANSRAVGVRYELIPEHDALEAMAAMHRAIAVPAGRP